MATRKPFSSLVGLFVALALGFGSFIAAPALEASAAPPGQPQPNTGGYNCTSSQGAMFLVDAYNSADDLCFVGVGQVNVAVYYKNQMYGGDYYGTVCHASGDCNTAAPYTTIGLNLYDEIIKVILSH